MQEKRGGSYRRKRGFQKERELVRKLWNIGFATIRAPASGAKARRTYQPDIIAVRNNIVFVIEAKTRKKEGTIYVESAQVEKVREWARRAGPDSWALIAVYINRRYGWRFIRVDDAEYTKGGNLKISVEKIRRGYTIDDLKRLTETNARKIDSFVDK